MAGSRGRIGPRGGKPPADGSGSGRDHRMPEGAGNRSAGGPWARAEGGAPELDRTGPGGGSRVRPGKRRPGREPGRGQRDGGARTVREGAGRSLHVAGADGPPGTSDRPEANGGKPVGIRASRLPDGGAGRDFRLRRRALRRRPAEASGASAGLPPLAANPAAFRPAAAPPAGSRVPTGIGCCRQTSIASLSAKPYNKLVAAGSGTDKPSESEDGMKQRSVLLFLYLFIGLLAG